MDDSTLLDGFTADEVIKLHLLKLRIANSEREEQAKHRVWRRLHEATNWVRENTRCVRCQVKTYSEDLQFGFCGNCVEQFQDAGRWCGLHGPLPVRIQWIDRMRNQYDLIILPCPSCPIEGVA